MKSSPGPNPLAAMPVTVLGVCRAVVVAPLVALAMMLSPAPGQTDTGSVSTAGGAVGILQENPHVRMVSEVVRAKVWEHECEVECLFVLKNEGPADSVLLGFPDGLQYENNNDDPAQIPDTLLSGFRAWVDGVEAACVPMRGLQGGSYDANLWWVSRAWFPKGATRRIRHTYTVGGWAEPVAHERGFAYTLQTGASWKGLIGSAEIFVTLEDVALDRVLRTSGSPTRSGKTYRWSLRNFEPGSADGSPDLIDIAWKDENYDVYRGKSEDAK